MLSYADETFDQALMLGFASSIRKEYAWRVKRGESLANLRAFARLTGGAAAGSARRRPSAGSSSSGQDLTSREMACGRLLDLVLGVGAALLDGLRSRSGPRWSSSSPIATACRARVAAEIWVSTSTQ